MSLRTDGSSRSQVNGNRGEGGSNPCHPQNPPRSLPSFSPRRRSVRVPAVSGAYDSRWSAVRLVVLERDGWRCRLELEGCTGVAEHVDHIVPLSEGGARLDPLNLRASCASCNLRRNRLRQTELARALLDGAAGSPEGPSRRW